MFHSLTASTHSALRVGGVLAALALVVTGCGEEAPPPTVPDVVGMAGDEARTAIEDEGFTVTFEAVESSVWQPANWEVESTEPGAGDELDEGGEVIAHLIRPEGEGETAADEEATEEPTEAASQFDFDVQDLGEHGVQVVATWDIPMGWSSETMARQAERDTLAALEEADAAHDDYDQIAINAYTETTDAYGNDDRSLVVIATYDRETVERINFDADGEIAVWSLRDGGGGCMPALCGN